MAFIKITIKHLNIDLLSALSVLEHKQCKCTQHSKLKSTNLFFFFFFFFFFNFIYSFKHFTWYSSKLKAFCMVNALLLCKF